MVEYWNIGKMGFGILEDWVNGVIVLTIKLKMDNILQKTHDSIIPQFHYSMIEAKSKTSKILYIFIKL